VTKFFPAKASCPSRSREDITWQNDGDDYSNNDDNGDTVTVR
jgi:hypothetical protein